MYLKFLAVLKRWLITYAKKRPYIHIDDYMSRWWIIPYKFEHAFRFFENPLGWLLQRFDIAIRVHEILRSDSDRAYHDHPWSYISILLEGGYYEVCPEEDGPRCIPTLIGRSYRRRYYPVGSVIYRGIAHKHRLMLVGKQPVTTLFITLGKKQSWGFYPSNGIFVPYKDYLKDHVQ